MDRDRWQTPSFLRVVCAVVALGLAGCSDAAPGGSVPAPPASDYSPDDAGYPIDDPGYPPDDPGYPPDDAGYAPDDAGCPRPDDTCPPPSCRRDPTVTQSGEEQYLDDIVLCWVTGEPTATLHNGTGVVWMLHGQSTHEPDTTLSSQIFREMVETTEFAGSRFLAPDETVALDIGPYGTDEWTVHPSLTGLWLNQEVIEGQVRKHLGAAATQTLSRGSRTRAAVITCAREAWRAGAGFADLSTPPEAFDAALGAVAAGGPCLQAGRLASQEVGHTRIWALTTLEDAARVAEAGTKARSTWSWLSRLCVATPRLC